ncbi:MAG: hypothetical protein AAGC60_12525 [Acidobacteriota bacterium]
MIALERSPRWEAAIHRFDRGERGVEADKAVEQIASKLGLKL